MNRQSLEERLRDEGLAAGAWGNGPSGRYAPHEHQYDKVLVCVQGAVRFGLPASGAHIDLAAGDRLDLPAGTRHEAAAGPDGVTCLEARVTSGRLPSLRHYPAGSW